MARRLQQPLAAAAGALFAAVIYGPRLPASDDMFLARRFGSAAFRPVLALWRAPFVPALLSWAALLAALAALVALGADLTADVRRTGALRSKSVKHVWLRASGAVLAAGLSLWLARAALAGGVALIERAWFLPEALDWREPLLLAALFCAVFGAAFRAAAEGGAWALAGGGRKTAARGLRWMGGLAVAAALGAVCEARLSALPKPDARPAAGRLLVLLASKDGKPDVQQRVVEWPSPAGDAGLPDMESALRLSYEDRTLAMDAPGLRAALERGAERGDTLARALLLENLLVAPVDDGARALLAGLSDESKLRVGPRAASRLALAWARFGEAERAAYWQGRASQGENALPPGLLSLPEPASVLSRGRIVGRLRVDGPARIALYARREPEQPYLLGPGQLVASQAVGEGGRFAFERLGAGTYYLAFAVEGRAAPLRLSGHRGDLELSRRRPEIGVWLEGR